MSIFEFAMKMEQDGEKFYRDLAGKIKNEGLKQIFTYLADEEVKHYNLFKGLHEHQPTNYESTDILAHSVNVFAQMKESGAIDVADDVSQLEAYKQALETEKKAYEFYEEKAGETSDPQEKQFLETVAKEERRHYRLLDGIIEFVGQPESWVEDAEFTQLTNY